MNRRLLWVTDGDTIVVLYRGKQERVRLLRIDTPERGQAGHSNSTQFLREYLKGKEITLEFERPRQLEQDRYERLLCYVFASGRNVNVEIVRAGWPPFWIKYGVGRYAEAFEKAEQEAKRKRIGPSYTSGDRNGGA